jgi:NAD-dependent deacetylase
MFEKGVAMKIVVFTGAGISQESGLKTFRDSDGLWEGYRVEDVCTVDAWRRQPQVVLDFYNARRRDVRSAVPNAAHYAVAELEKSGHDVTVVTQNVDDLHERAGSQNVLHLHGLITQMRPNGSPQLVDCPGDIRLGDKDASGRQYRPHVVFFGEDVQNISKSIEISQDADILLVIGSTLQVYPAALVAEETGAKCVWVVDPRRPDNLRISDPDWGPKVVFIEKPATIGTKEAVSEIIALGG